ncbi:unnamed protein product, partial [Rotaria magnacalcarata]
MVEILSDDLYNAPQFSITQHDFLLALFDDACGQLANIGYGLYYRAYTNNFKALSGWFNTNWRVTQRVVSGLSNRIRQGISQRELESLLSIFEFSMVSWRYAIAFDFANGNDKGAYEFLKKSAESNIQMKKVFNAVKPNETALIRYEAILAKHAENNEG